MSQESDSLPAIKITDGNAPIGAFENVNNLVGTVQNLIALFVGLTAILSGAGFVIVNVHLSKFTDIQGLNISPDQYIFAGIGFVVFGFINLIVYICSEYMQNLNEKFKEFKPQTRYQWIKKCFIRLLLLFLSILPIIIFLRILSFLNTSTYLVLELVSYVLIYTIKFRKQIAKSLSGVTNKIILMVALLTYIIVGGYTYAESVYQFIPSYLVGGQPKTAIVVFKSEVDLNGFGIAQNPTQKTHTQNILILADLRDGLLILDPTSGQVVAIKDESILGIYDDKVNTQYVVTATPTFTPSPTVTQTPNVTLSPTP